MTKPSLFEAALGSRWAQMPEEWRQFHSGKDGARFAGRGMVERGKKPLGWVIAWALRFPPTQADVAVSVHVACRDDQETWERNFGGQHFRSVLRAAGADHVYEKFGPITVFVSLTGDTTFMGMEVKRAWFLGIPLPNWARPRSVVRESAEEGRFRFSVEVSHPLCGMIVRYVGWLAPEHTRG